jgi:hypothetical protein
MGGGFPLIVLGKALNGKPGAGTAKKKGLH